MSAAPTSTRIRVLVVEDSLTVRKHLVEALSAEPGIDVVGEAADGQAGIELCQQLRPDVVTMDMMLPVMTGLAATEYIMAYCPTPILIVSASTNRGEVFRTYDALAAGAVDVLDKPLGDEPDEAWERRLVAAVRMVAKIRVITHPRGRLGGRYAGGPQPRPRPASAPRASSGVHEVVAVGASTGGPSALLTVLGSLPPDFALPVLVVLHISEPFGLAMAEWLDAQVSLEVRFAKDGERLPPRGCVLMAPPDRHLEVIHGRLRLTDGPERHFCRPSVDVLFESLAHDVGASAVACLLTGMGRDGAQGMLSVRQAGGLTLAQDRATSVVFGMPGEAIRLNAASQVLALSELAPTLTRLARRAQEQRSG